MTRWLSVLIALLAQTMLLLSPTYFVQCVGADGHRCLELAGQDCHCSDAELDDHEHEHCKPTPCGSVDHSGHSDLGHVFQVQDDCDCQHSRRGRETRAEQHVFQVQDDCDCLHSPVQVASGVQVKTSAQAIDVNLMSSVMLSAWSGPALVDPMGRTFAVNLLRQFLDPHLAELATSVLRV